MWLTTGPFELNMYSDIRHDSVVYSFDHQIGAVVVVVL